MALPCTTHIQAGIAHLSLAYITFVTATSRDGHRMKTTDKLPISFRPVPLACLFFFIRFVQRILCGKRREQRLGDSEHVPSTVPVASSSVWHGPGLARGFGSLSQAACTGWCMDLEVWSVRYWGLNVTHPMWYSGIVDFQLRVFSLCDSFIRASRSRLRAFSSRSNLATFSGRRNSCEWVGVGKIMVSVFASWSGLLRIRQSAPLEVSMNM